MLATHPRLVFLWVGSRGAWARLMLVLGRWRTRGDLCSPGLAGHKLFPLSLWCVSIKLVLGPEVGAAQLRFGQGWGFTEVPEGVKPGL